MPGSLVAFAALRARAKARSGLEDATRADAGLPTDLLAAFDLTGFSARFVHAIDSACLTVAASAAASRTWVLPWRPQPPGTGAKTFGVVATSSACWSGVSCT